MPAMLTLLFSRLVMPALVVAGSLAMKWFGPTATSIKKQINVVELMQVVMTGLVSGLATHHVFLSILNEVSAHASHIFAAGSLMAGVFAAGVDLAHRFWQGVEITPVTPPVVTPVVPTPTPVADPTVTPTS